MWAEEDVSPPNIDLRNTVKFVAVDENCQDIDTAVPGRSDLVIEYLKQYRTITVFRVYETPIVLPLELDIQLEVSEGFIPSAVIADVESNILTACHATYFDFNTRLDKSFFWELVTTTGGVATATVAWTIDGTPESGDYWQVPAPDEFKKIVTLTRVTAVLL